LIGMKAQIRFGENWVKVNESVFYVSPQIVKAIKHVVETLAKENLEPEPEEVELYAKALLLLKPTTVEEADHYINVIATLETIDDFFRVKEIIDRIYANRSADVMVREL